MGSSQTKEKRGRPSEKLVEGLKEKVRLLQGEMVETMCVRETERQVYEREWMVSAFRQEEWRRERKCLKEEVKRLRKILEEKQERLRCMAQNPTCCKCNLSDQLKEEEEEARRDETLEKWKQLYFAIKNELDDLIHRTHREERLWWKREEGGVVVEMKGELREKEERIEFLQAKVAAMECEELRREREMDILRQSLRIMSHRNRPKSIKSRILQCGLLM